MITTEVLQKVQLVEGEFTPSEASSVVQSLIDEKINFHKIQRLCSNIHDELCETEYPNSRIAELMDEKLKAKAIISEARTLGYDLKIEGTLEMTFVKRNYNKKNNG